MQFRRRLITAFIAVVALSASAADASGGSDELQHVTLKLYTFEEEGTELHEVASGGEIRNSPGNCYGWNLHFDPVDAQIPIEELLLLPASAAHWGSEDSVIAADGMSAISRTVVNGARGKAGRSWCVAPGDPDGPYKFVIKAHDKTLGELRFNLTK